VIPSVPTAGNPLATTERGFQMARTTTLRIEFSRESVRGKYAFRLIGAEEAVRAAFGDVPSISPVRLTVADSGVATLRVRVGACGAPRIAATTSMPIEDAAMVASGGAADFPAADVPAVAGWLGDAARTWAERRAAGQLDNAGTDALGSAAVGLAMGDSDVEAAMTFRQGIARRPTAQRAAAARAKLAE